eukprot:TRINITY_DN18556_c0_g2_i1.p1 TRINITY_DN18556_c0_g2~~TRINITY_DN18556_c0_g2_i1.p1  ORF type:complete len:501 (+),score=90.91 TRINITY_DN18556_c0_g2_i1:120-1622(+)
MHQNRVYEAEETQAAVSPPAPPQSGERLDTDTDTRTKDEERVEGEHEDDEDDEDEATFLRDETMNEIIYDCEGRLQEVESSTMGWYQQALRDQQAFLSAAGSPPQPPVLPWDEEEEEEQQLSSPATTTEEGEEEEGDGWNGGGSAFERYLSTCSEGEEWVIERILRRQRAKTGGYSYLVKWRGVADPCWELEEDLLHGGYDDWVDKFQRDHEQRVRAQLTAAPGRRQKKPDKVKKEPRHDAPIPPCPQDEFSPEAFWPDFTVRISNALNQAGQVVTRLQNVVQPEIRKAFSEAWRTLNAGVPVMVFHGTREENVPGIIRDGLVIPGTVPGVGVANGSAHGVGIYSSLNATDPVSYCKGGNYLFVCAGLVGPHFATTTKEVGQWVVFFQPVQVLVCFLVEFHPLPGVRVQGLRPHYVNTIWTGPGRWPCTKYEGIDLSKLGGNLPGGNFTNMERHYPGQYPPSDAPGWVKDTKRRTLTRRELRGVARRVRQLYESGVVRQY